MPYIKKDLRPPFDSAIIVIQQERIGEAVDRILNAVKNLADSDVDGCLNYVFTQALRKVDDLVTVGIVMDLVLSGLFWSSPKYFRFERVRGLLGCMIDEYTRRGWRRQKKAIKVIRRVMAMGIRYTATYEDLKIEQNGDLE